MAELLDVVADAVVAAGGTSTTHVGAFPADDGDSVYVVVPHEYFVLTPADLLPGPHRLARTIGFCVEHPGTATFETSASWAARLGAAIDINRDSIEELRRRGVEATRFVLGYSKLWDRWHRAEADRHIDITYLGTTDSRRDNLLCRQALSLGDWRTALLIPPHEQMTRPRPDFLMGPAKHEHLANSRVLLNLHRGGSRALEWVRVLEAMINGCVVVSEHSTDFAPLVPGVHIAFARGHAVADVAAALLRHPDRLATMRDTARDMCVEGLSMHASAVELLEIGARLANPRPGRPAPVAPASAASAVPTQPEPPPPESRLPQLAAWAAAIPPEGRQEIAAFIAAHSDLAALVVNEHLFGDGAAGPWVVDAIVAGVGDPVGTSLTVSSLAVQGLAVRVLTGEIATTPTVSVRRGAVRNELLRRGSSDLVLVIEPGQQLLAGALPRLVDALRTNFSAAVAYPMVADMVGGGLWNSLPPEPGRLAARAYIGAPLLVRAEVLRRLEGFSEDPAVDGYEDHELWLRLVASGCTGVLVPQILATGQRAEPPPYGIAALTPELTLAALSRALHGAVLGAPV